MVAAPLLAVGGALVATLTLGVSEAVYAELLRISWREHLGMWIPRHLLSTGLLAGACGLLAAVVTAPARPARVYARRSGQDGPPGYRLGLPAGLLVGLVGVWAGGGRTAWSDRADRGAGVRRAGRVCCAAQQPAAAYGGLAPPASGRDAVLVPVRRRPSGRRKLDPVRRIWMVPHEPAVAGRPGPVAAAAAALLQVRMRGGGTAPCRAGVPVPARPAAGLAGRPGAGRPGRAGPGRRVAPRSAQAAPGTGSRSARGADRNRPGRTRCSQTGRDSPGRAQPDRGGGGRAGGSEGG